VGVSHLQPAALDPSEEASHRHSKLGRKREENPECPTERCKNNSRPDP